MGRGIPDVPRGDGLALAVLMPSTSPDRRPTAMSRVDLRFRQIHLDFHTSEHIAHIGQAFDPDAFAGTLERARVDSVTCFARCHHGWMYYDTEQFPERRHPHLCRNLLAEQIEACHARDIRVPIYTTVQWDHYTAEQRPEWLAIDQEGRQIGTSPYEPGFYRRLCINSPYTDFLKAHVQEVLATLPTDGIFFDIVQPTACSCRHCRELMAEEGLDPSDGRDRERHALESINAFKQNMTAFVRQHSPECTVFYNAGHVGPRHRAVAKAFTHFELESLPSGGWGYVHFPMAVRYARTLGLDCMGMTGKFHTSWGDFHSFKNPEALAFECFQMLAQGAKCSIGDQLHPEGEICQTTYDLIQPVYSEVERKEPWCENAEPVVDIGLLTTEEFTGERVPQIVSGAIRMLQEGAHQFDIIDTASDLSPYRMVILPDRVPVSEAFGAKLSEYLAGGGAVVASYRSGLKECGEGFALDEFGVSLKGEAPYSPDFVLPEGQIGKGLPGTEHAMYRKGLEVVPADGATVLARVAMPYFNRTYRHFCSHRHTPSSAQPGYPAVVQRGRVVYFAHPIFTQYAQNAPRWVKQLLLNAVDILLPDPLVRTDAPSTAITALNAQQRENRLVLHLLHYIPERRGQDFDVIEDVIPIHDVEASVRVSGTVKEVRCVPDGDALPFSEEGSRVVFTVPVVEGHQMVAITMGE